MISITPSSVAFQVGPLPIYWYGICYALGLAVAYIVMAREARRRGMDAEILANGMIVVAAAALIGGRAYHVIDQWALYKDDLIRIVMPPYSGLGVYGGLATGVLAAVLYARWKRVPFWPWADVVAPGLFLMQAIGRLGNFFNQELYGPPTNLPWGIAIDCAHRLPEFPCETYPLATTGFHPLFFYESISGLLGAVALLWLARRFGRRLRPGDLVLVFFIWYPTVRFLLETLRTDNWRVGGIPTAQLVSVLFVAASALVLLYRHRGRSGTEARTDDQDRFTGREDPFDDDPFGDLEDDLDEDPNRNDADDVGSDAADDDAAGGRGQDREDPALDRDGPRSRSGREPA
jgi:phosphatidylglycerol:prolipoprotein diacylglycerol transferase